MLPLLCQGNLSDVTAGVTVNSFLSKCQFFTLVCILFLFFNRWKHVALPFSGFFSYHDSKVHFIPHDSQVGRKAVL